MEQKKQMLPWAARINDLSRAGVAHAILLHGNIYDYTQPRVPLEAQLRSMFNANFLCVNYSRSRGLSFWNQEAERTFRQNAMQSAPADPFSTQTPDDTLPSDPAIVIPALDRFIRKVNRAVVIINEPQTLIPPADWSTMRELDRQSVTTIASWGRDLEIANRKCMVLLVCESINDVHPFVRSARYEPVRISLPGYDERLAFIRYFIGEEFAKSEDMNWEAGFGAEGLARGTGGLRSIDIDDILLRSVSESVCSPKFVRERKRSIFESLFADVLEPVESATRFDDIGGYDYVKTYLQNMVIPAFQRGDEDVPMAMLFMGPAGTGKTQFMLAMANQLGFQVVNLKVGRTTSMWQGEGERKMMKALDAIEAFSPVMVIMDELDQQARRGTGSSNEQEMRLFQLLNEFVGDKRHRGKILFVGATNRPDLIDAALKRPGRFGDAKIPVLMPEPEDRLEILLVHGRLQKLELKQEHMPALRRIAYEQTSGWSGVELANLIRKTKQLMSNDPELSIEAALFEANRRIRATTSNVQDMTRAALEEVNDRDLVPPGYWNWWDSSLEQNKVREVAENVPIRRRAEGRENG